MALTKGFLDASGCGTPDCGHDHSVLFFKSRCHPGAGVEVMYVKAEGVMRVVCKKCRRQVADVKVSK